MLAEDFSARAGLLLTRRWALYLVSRPSVIFSFYILSASSMMGL
jgi:hypothetical protein